MEVWNILLYIVLAVIAIFVFISVIMSLDDKGKQSIWPFYEARDKILEGSFSFSGIETEAFFEKLDVIKLNLNEWLREVFR